MSIPTAFVFLVVLIALGFSIRGLFNRHRSIPCTISSIAVFLGAGLCAWYSWAESRSLPWTTAYGGAALLGVVSIFRQVRFSKLKQSNAEHVPPGQASPP